MTLPSACLGLTLMEFTTFRYVLQSNFGIKLQTMQKFSLLQQGKVIYPKYSKYWPYTVAHTIDCVCSKILNHGLNHFQAYTLPRPYIELYMC